MESREENQNQNTEAVSRPPPGHLQDCPGVSVEFHVVIHEEWMFDPSKGDKSVHIRFGGSPELGNWKWDCVDMKPAVLDECRLKVRSIWTFTVFFLEILE